MNLNKIHDVANKSYVNSEGIGFLNYFTTTYGEWLMLDNPQEYINTAKPDYVSASGSSYWYIKYNGEPAVIRRADHWSTVILEDGTEAFPISRNIGRCYWKLCTSLANNAFVCVNSTYKSSSLVNNNGEAEDVYAIILLKNFNWVSSYPYLNSSCGAIYGEYKTAEDVQEERKEEEASGFEENKSFEDTAIVCQEHIMENVHDIARLASNYLYYKHGLYTNIINNNPNETQGSVEVVWNNNKNVKLIFKYSLTNSAINYVYF